jgi:glycosyltransferase 2 family protein
VQPAATLEPSKRRSKSAIRVFLSVAVSAVFVALSVRHTDARAVLSAMARANGWVLVGYVGVLLVVHVIRTVRWQLLLAPLGRVTFARVNSATAIGFMLLMILPLRLGELGRPLLVSRPDANGEARLPRSGALASAVVDRIIDSLGVGVLGIVSLRLLATSGTAADFARHASVVATAGFAIMCVMLVIAYFMRDRMVELVRRLVSAISHKLADRVAGILDRFIQGLHLGSAGRLAAVLLLTAVHWAVHVVGFWMVAGAFGLEITLLMCCAVVASNVLGGMIPAGPGMVGTSQFFTQLGVSIFVAGALTDPEIAARTVAYANTIWLLQFVQQVVLGLIFVAIGHESLTGLFRLSTSEAT